MIKILKWTIAFSFFAGSLFVLFSTHFSPARHFMLSVFALMIPTITLLNFLLLIYYLIRKSPMLFLPLFILIIFAVKYLPATINYNFSPEIPSENSFKVLSYNVSQFARPQKYYFDRRWKGDSVMAKSKGIIDFVANYEADIKCLQEFYTDSNSVLYNTSEKISRGHHLNVVQSTKLLRINRAKFGVAIFSRFPVVNHGELIYSNNEFNRGVYADLKIGNDTVRVINIHLQSNQLKIAAKRKFLSKWKYDEIRRAKQTDQLTEFISKSPYRIILCGDFNSTPYGYVYNEFNKDLANSFEYRGSGIGGTFHFGQFPILRIDHHFFSDGLGVEEFNTLDSITYSDHYPIEGKYQIRSF